MFKGLIVTLGNYEIEFDGDCCVVGDCVTEAPYISIDGDFCVISGLDSIDEVTELLDTVKTLRNYIKGVHYE
jgi:hypothetical protein